MAFDFAKMETSFNALLGLGWQESQDKGWYRVPENTINTPVRAFLSYCNKSFGYKFKEGTSPALGKTIICDPLATSQYGQFGSPASAAFNAAAGQVNAQHHSRGKAANGLALNVFFQNLYQQGGVLEEWGQWSMGFNRSNFNTFKFSQNAHEGEFMRHADDLIRRQAQKENSGLHSSLSVYSGDTTNVMLKVKQTHDLGRVLKPLEEPLVRMIDVVKSGVGLSKEYPKIVKSLNLD